MIVTDSDFPNVPEIEEFVCIQTLHSVKKSLLYYPNFLMIGCAYEIKRDGEKIIDLYYIASDTATDNLLFVHVGQVSEDTVLILFSNTDIVKVKKHFIKLKENE